MQTTIGVNSPLAVQRWSNALAVDVAKKQYFTKFIGDGENNIIDRKVDLESDEGDRVRFDLSMRLRGDIVEGDNNVEGTEENLTFHQDEVRIDQARKGADAGGRMSRKRTLHDLRRIARDRTGDFMAEWFDELMLVYLSGTTAGTNAGAKVRREFAGNPVQAPDSHHMVYGGNATSKATITSAHTMSRDLIERLSVMSGMMNELNPDVIEMQPVTVEGEKHFVLLMSPFQEHALRAEKGELSWADIQKALATSEGRASPLCKGGLGMIADVVLHKHKNVRLFNDYGTGGNLPAARALFMGKQAGVVAYGQAGNNKGARFTWHEELKDAGNRVAIYAGSICGFKKTRFNGFDFGVVAVDTYANNPNPIIAA